MSLVNYAYIHELVELLERHWSIGFSAGGLKLRSIKPLLMEVNMIRNPVVHFRKVGNREVAALLAAALKLEDIIDRS